MKGLIFNLLEEFLAERCGEEVFEEIIAACDHLETDPQTMVAPGSYADSDFTALVEHAAISMGVPADRLLHDFGRHAIGALTRRYPQFFAPHRHPRDFLASMGFIHSLEVKKLYGGATPPAFGYESLADGRLRITYHSARRLCAFFSGLIEGVGRHYGVPMTQSHEACTARGDAACVFLLTFADAGAAGPENGARS
jgi:hypothetical protein